MLSVFLSIVSFLYSARFYHFPGTVVWCNPARNCDHSSVNPGCNGAAIRSHSFQEFSCLCMYVEMFILSLTKRNFILLTSFWLRLYYFKQSCFCFVNISCFSPFYRFLGIFAALVFIHHTPIHWHWLAAHQIQLPVGPSSITCHLVKFAYYKCGEVMPIRYNFEIRNYRSTVDKPVQVCIYDVRICFG